MCGLLHGCGIYAHAHRSMLAGQNKFIIIILGRVKRREISAEVRIRDNFHEIFKILFEYMTVSSQAPAHSRGSQIEEQVKLSSSGIRELFEDQSSKAAACTRVTLFSGSWVNESREQSRRILRISQDNAVPASSKAGQRGTSFRLCHRQGHYLYHFKALSERAKATPPRPRAPFWRACQPVVKVAEGQPRVTFKGPGRAGKPPSQLEVSFCPRPLNFEQSDRRAGRSNRRMPRDH